MVESDHLGGRRHMKAKDFDERFDQGEDVTSSLDLDASPALRPTRAARRLADVDVQGEALLPAQSELTTQQAAELLNVSRPYLINLLSKGEIEYRMVGTHRRVMASSLPEYRARDDAQRRDAADELGAMARDAGLD